MHVLDTYTFNELDDENLSIKANRRFFEHSRAAYSVVCDQI